MSKEANTAHEIHPLLKKRWSIRAFDSRPVETEKLCSLFEAARWSASAANQQPWRFIVGIRGEEGYSAILDSLDEGNRVWAHQAPVLLVCVAKTTNNRERPNPYYQYDAGQAMAHLSVQATELGLYVHQMGGFSPDAVTGSFSIPEPYLPLTAAAIGYRGDPASLTEPNHSRELAPRERQPLSDMVFSGKFGETASFFL